VSAVVALAVSPLLAGWSAALAEGQTSGWWRPRRVTVSRGAVVAIAAVGFGSLAVASRPWTAGWLFAAGATVLAVVDAEKSKFCCPVCSAPWLRLRGPSSSSPRPRHGEPHRLLRALMAASVLGAVWFVLAFLADGGMGLGDVRVAAMTGGLLGWLDCPRFWMVNSRRSCSRR